MREAGFTVHALSEYTTRKSPLSRTDCTVPICPMFWGGEGEGEERGGGGEGRGGGGEGRRRGKSGEGEKTVRRGRDGGGRRANFMRTGRYQGCTLL